MVARRRWALASAVVVLALGALMATRPPRVTSLPPNALPSSDAAPPPIVEAPPLTGRVPQGAPPSLTCSQAQVIARQVRALLVDRPGSLEGKPFGHAVADWLDPHGLWSAAPDSPAAALLQKRAASLRDALLVEGAGCDVAVEVGATLARSVAELRAAFDEARASARANGSDVHAAFEAGDVTRPAARLAADLGAESGALERRAPGLAALVEVARGRYFPDYSARGWSEVVLAAALRAYVPSVDPHGAWAPFEEEASLYEAELEARPPPPFWESIARTALGVRVEAGPLEPLAVGDTVLAVEGVALAGMPLEQIGQFAYTLADERSSVRMRVLRADATAAVELTVKVPSPEALAATREGLSRDRVRYGDGEALVVGIRDVREDLGDELTSLLRRERATGAPLTGVVLDLRGNGGGSTDGAAAALGVFLPGAPLFPMKRRDGTVEIDRATEPAEGDRWDGPVAALVDRGTASAAEMIAGALGAYQRGVVVGERTFGKGCAQEYFEDDGEVGVLRLTTLVFALPDGSPLQRVGLLPTLLVPFGREAAESEAQLRGAPALFRGPDVRDARRVAAYASRAPWPPAKGRADVGPCKEEDVCVGLRALAASSLRRAAKR